MPALEGKRISRALVGLTRNLLPVVKIVWIAWLRRSDRIPLDEPCDSDEDPDGVERLAGGSSIDAAREVERQDHPTAAEIHGAVRYADRLRHDGPGTIATDALLQDDARSDGSVEREI